MTLQLAIKRLLDVMLSAIALLVVAPLVAVLALLIRLESPGHPLIKQRRIGRRGRVFNMYKLRSMVQDAPLVLNEDGSCTVAANDPRVTPLGATLRRFGLDELPQLINVLKGEMSLIGPRPDMACQLAHYGDDDHRKLAMRPGITSLAQVSGRNLLSWEHRMALEARYVEEFSLWLDLTIAWRTLGIIASGVGLHSPSQRASPAGQETSEGSIAGYHGGSSGS
jgi:lipopolysaccharide/colanic/teichoic acid biosynthesis glycosyltransferase